MTTKELFGTVQAIQDYLSAGGSAVTAEMIYKEFPLKVAKPKALLAIKKAMRKIKPEKLLQLTMDYAKARDGDLAFMPHPSTWFNQERYNDDPSTWISQNANNQKPSSQRVDRSEGTTNAGLASKYANLG